MVHGTRPDVLSPRKLCRARRGLGLLFGILLASVLSGCSLYDEGRSLVERPLEVL